MVNNIIKANKITLTKNSNNTFSFINRLDFDIIVVIFSFLRQQDCLTCMTVCKDWYIRVPDYSFNNWKTLQFSGTNALTAINDRRLKICLGNHVNSVEFNLIKKEHQANFIIQKLLELGCHKINSLGFNNCTIVNYNKFLISLRQFEVSSSAHLTHLILENHQSNVPFDHVLHACPQLTHFTFRPARNIPMDVYDQEPSIMAKQHSNSNDMNSEEEQQAKPSYTFDKLIYLHIDAVLHIEYRLKPILKKCPNLKYFIGPSHDSCAYQANTVSTYSINSSAARRTRNTIEFNDLLLWCPKLAYYVGDRSYYRDEYPTLVKKNSNMDKVLGRDNLYHLSINEQQYGYNQTAQILYQHKDTLEYLKLHRGFMSSFREDSHNVDNDDEEANPDWSYVFDHYQLSRLQTLICDHIQFNTASIINLLNSCSETIKTLDISMGPDDRQSQHHRTRLNNYILSFDYFALQHMHTLTQLYTLRLTSVLFKDKNSVVIMLKQLPCLENLTIRASAFLLPESAAIFLNNLKHLELWALSPSQSEAQRQRQRQRQRPHNRNNSTINTRNGNDNNETITDNEYEDYEKPGVIEPGVFQSLAFMDGSKLETIQISGITNVPSMHSLPFAIASLSTLKYLELKLNGSPLFGVSRDDGGIALLDFAIMLRENSKCIEHLTLNQVRCVSYHALEVLGGLPKLKILNIRLAIRPKFADRNNNNTKGFFSLHGVLQLLITSKSLEKAVFFSALAINDSPKDILQQLLLETEQENQMSSNYFSCRVNTMKTADYIVTSKGTLKFKDTFIEDVTITHCRRGII